MKQVYRSFGLPNKSRAEKLRLSKLSIAVVAAVFSSVAYSVQYEWVGAGDVSDFLDSDNWSGGSVPVDGPATDIIINNNPGPQSCCGVLYDINSITIGGGAGSQVEMSFPISTSYMYANSINLAVDGGGAEINFSVEQSYSAHKIQANNLKLGSGLGSSLVINALGSGKVQNGNHNSGVEVSIQGGTGVPVGIGEDQGRAVINLDGAGLAFDNAQYILGSGLNSEGRVNVLSGGKFANNLPSYSFNPPSAHGLIIGSGGGTGVLSIDNTGSSVLTRGLLGLGVIVGDGAGSLGQIDVLGGGQLVAYSSYAGATGNYNSQIGANGGRGVVNIGGESSIWMVTGQYETPEDLISEIGQISVGYSGEGVVSVYDGGELFVGAVESSVDGGGADEDYPLTRTPIYSRLGDLYLAEGLGSSGTLNIGSDPITSIGSAAAGKVSAQKIIIGQGAATINFNHSGDIKISDVLPVFDFSQQGSVGLVLASYSGSTHIDRANVGFDGETQVYGGALWIEDQQSLGTSLVKSIYRTDMPNGGSLVYSSGIALENEISLGAASNLNLVVLSGNQAGQVGSVSGDGHLTKLGAGLLELFDADHSGATNVVEGELRSAELYALSANSEVNISAGAKLGLSRFSQEIGSVNNSGSIDFGSVGAGQAFTPVTLTVNGAAGYQGDNGLVEISTQLAGDASPTDKLVIAGASSGTARLKVNNAGGQGGQTTTGIEVVSVAGASSANFSLEGPVQAGAYEYVLQKGTRQNPNNGNWYLRNKTDEPDPEQLYRPLVPNILAAHNIVYESGYRLLASLHQRFGSQSRLVGDEELSWFRVYGDKFNTAGSRLSYKAHVKAMQFGHDLWVDENAQGWVQRVGLSFDYSDSHGKFKDHAREAFDFERNNTGSMDGKTVSLGGYHTIVTPSGSYLDTVVTVSDIKLKMKDVYSGDATQKALRLGASAEIGHVFASYSEQWLLEPQVQLSYQNTIYKSFNDDIGHVAGKTHQNLRGRLGLRVARDKVGENGSGQIYAIANYMHDFLRAESVEFDGVSLREKYDRDFAEVGLGGSWPVTQSASFYGDARYRRSLGGKSEGGILNLGMQIDF